MNILQRLFNKRPASTSATCRYYESAAGKRRGADPLPLLIFGHSADQTAERMARDTTFNCVAVSSLEELQSYLNTQVALGIRAHSRPDFPGEAGAAIQMFKRYIQGITFYGAWDYNVARAAARALEYEADGIDMPGIQTDEEYAYIIGVIGEVFEGLPRSTTVAQHEERLRKFTTNASPFWSQQDKVVSPFY